MTVISSHTDADALTLTFVADFDASAERVWQLWEDPRQLEWWSGSADLAGHLREARLRSRRSVELLHDRRQRLTSAATGWANV